jgi:hypothetical protein
MTKSALVIIDCETLSTFVESAPIISIGAYLMGIIETDESKRTGKDFWEQVEDYNLISDSFHTIVNYKYQIASGRKIDTATWDWWQSVGGKAVELLDRSRETNLSLCVGLGWLSQWIKDIEGKVDEVIVLGNGAAFDNVLLEIAYREYGLDIPWKYSHSLCLRTLYGIFGLESTKFEVSDVAKEMVTAKHGSFIAHDALHDCIYQAHKARMIVPGELWVNLTNNLHKRKK